MRILSSLILSTLPAILAVSPLWAQYRNWSVVDPTASDKIAPGQPH